MRQLLFAALFIFLITSCGGDDAGMKNRDGEFNPSDTEVENDIYEEQYEQLEQNNSTGKIIGAFGIILGEQVPNRLVEKSNHSINVGKYRYTRLRLKDTPDNWDLVYIDVDPNNVVFKIEGIADKDYDEFEAEGAGLASAVMDKYPGGKMTEDNTYVLSKYQSFKTIVYNYSKGSNRLEAGSKVHEVFSTSGKMKEYPRVYYELVDETVKANAEKVYLTKHKKEIMEKGKEAKSKYGDL